MRLLLVVMSLFLFAITCGKPKDTDVPDDTSGAVDSADTSVPTDTAESGIDTDTVGDTECPVIQSDAITTTETYGEPVPIHATITDAGCGVFMATVYYRQETSSTWSTTGLTRSGETDAWVGEIPGADVRTGGIYYYLYAIDACGNECTLPTSEDEAWHFRISS